MARKVKENAVTGRYFLENSSEVRDILGRRPSWILRWGITVIALIIFLLVVGCYVIRYPRTVTATVVLTSSNPPSDLKAKTSGILDSVYISNGAAVAKGDLIALVAGAADYDDINKVEKYLRNPGDGIIPDIENPFGLRLGDIQQEWTEYLGICSGYSSYLSIDQIGKKKALLKEQVTRSSDYYDKLSKQRETLAEQYGYERTALLRDSVLLSRKAISMAEYENSAKALLEKKNTIAGFDASMSNAVLERLQIEQQIYELDVQRSLEVSDFDTRKAQAASSLLSRISIWKEQYAIIAPYDGIVSLQNVWGGGQHVSSGDVIASVVPVGGVDVVGRLKVPSAGFGQVEPGQEVNVRLNGFPYLEFGLLKGRVSSISTVPEKTDGGLFYTVVVELPADLETTYHIKLPFVQEMDGIAEIITEDMRLIEHFTRPVKSLFLNH